MARPLVLGVVVGLAALLILSFPMGDGSASSVSPPGRASSVLPEITPAAAPNPFVTGMAASVAIGASNLSGTWTLTVNASTFGGAPEDANFAPNGDLWVTDFVGNRVLGFTPPFSTGEAASIVLGQSAFTTSAPGTSATNLTEPGASTFDARGDLWVSDFGNNRVLEFVPPFANGMAASLVLGQSSFTGNQPNLTAVNLSSPVGLAFDSHGDLWVVDRDNNRVVEYAPPFTTGMGSSVAIGQSKLTTGEAGLSQSNLTFPLGVAAEGTTLWVADYGNGRVLAFPLPAVSGENASLVLGQSSFTSSEAPLPAGLSGPLCVSVDGQGNLWVSDELENRVVEFQPPFTTYETPAIAVGQSTLTGNAPGLSATNLSAPFGAVVSSSGDLWVTDLGNNRLVEYVPSVYPVGLSETGLPSGTTWSATVNGQTVRGIGSLNFPSEPNGTYAVAVGVVAGYGADPTVAPLVVDGGAAALVIQFNSIGPRIYSNGMAASVVLGQPNFFSAESPGIPVNGSGLGGDNFAAAFDSHGDLWVADSELNRVLEYVPPFANGMAASLVLGQSSLSGSVAGVTATNLSFPDGLTFDPAGDLWVADYSNNRVLEFTPPFSTGMPASLVVGQSNFTNSSPGSGATNLYGPGGISFTNGSLWVTDLDNNRVLEYPGLELSSNGPPAALVLGQSTLTGFADGLSAVNLSTPDWVAFDGKGDAWIADEGNNRALEYLAPLATGEAASVVLGQASFTSSTSPLPAGLDQPNGVTVDSQGNVWVADSGDNRTVEFAGPSFANYQTPSLVLGQGNLTSSGASLGPSGESYPTLLVADTHQNLWVVDAGNERVLGYVPAQYALTFSATGLPGGMTWSVSVNATSHQNTGTDVVLSEENGSYSWTAPSVGGYSFSPDSGTAVVNGGPVTVSLTAVPPVTYLVTFVPKGLSSSTTWSVTLGGSTLRNTTGGSITFSEGNGTYPYTVGAVSGYSIGANASGSALVVGGAASINVVFASTSPSSSSAAWATVGPVLLLIVVVFVVAVAVAVFWTRRRKGKTPPSAVGAPAPPSHSPSTGGTPILPPSSGGPPPGAM